jgi:hypothetical protein
MPDAPLAPAAISTAAKTAAKNILTIFTPSRKERPAVA